MENEKKDIFEEEKEAGQNAQLPVESKQEKKKSWLSSKIISFLTSDDYKTTLNKIYKTMVIPMAQKLAVDAFRMFVYQGKNSNESLGTYTPYESFSNELGYGSFKGSENYIPRQPFKDIPFRSKNEAEAVLRALYQELRAKRIVTVADYYRIANMRPEPSYYNHGWGKLDGASIFSYRDSKGRDIWSIKFPATIHVETRYDN